MGNILNFNCCRPLNFTELILTNTLTQAGCQSRAFFLKVIWSADKCHCTQRGGIVEKFPQRSLKAAMSYIIHILNYVDDHTVPMVSFYNKVNVLLPWVMGWAAFYHNTLNHQSVSSRNVRVVFRQTASVMYEGPWFTVRPANAPGNSAVSR